MPQRPVLRVQVSDLTASVTDVFRWMLPDPEGIDGQTVGRGGCRGAGASVLSSSLPHFRYLIYTWQAAIVGPWRCIPVDLSHSIVCNSTFRQLRFQPSTVAWASSSSIMSTVTKPKLPPVAMDTITQQIGNTPIVKLNRIPQSLGIDATVYAKLEFFNAGGSVKDRIALRMIEEAERSGRIKPGDTLIEPTSGNTYVGRRELDHVA